MPPSVVRGVYRQIAETWEPIIAAMDFSLTYPSAARVRPLNLEIHNYVLFAAAISGDRDLARRIARMYPIDAVDEQTPQFRVRTSILHMLLAASTSWNPKPMLPTFGKPTRCPICSTTLPAPNSEESFCPRCSAHLWHVHFPSAGLRFLPTQPHRSLDEVLLDLAEPHAPDLVRLLRTPPEELNADPLDNIELHLHLLQELEHHLPELKS